MGWRDLFKRGVSAVSSLFGRRQEGADRGPSASAVTGGPTPAQQQAPNALQPPANLKEDGFVKREDRAPPAGARRPRPPLGAGYIGKDDANAPIEHAAAATFVPGRDPQNPLLQQELQAKVEEVRSAREKDPRYSDKTLKPMLAGVMDTESGSIFTSANRTQVPEVLHSLMAERLDADLNVFDAYSSLSPEERASVKSMKPEQMAKFMQDRKVPAMAGGMSTSEMLRLADSRMRLREQQLKQEAGYATMTAEQREAALQEKFVQARGEIGTHGEFNALNAALLKRQAGRKEQLTADDLKGFLLHNTYATAGKDGTVGAMPRCHHCEALTGGVSRTAHLAHADATRDRHEANQR